MRLVLSMRQGLSAWFAQAVPAVLAAYYGAGPEDRPIAVGQATCGQHVRLWSAHTHL